MDARELLSSAWPYINDLDWEDDSFKKEKAYVCALFSECAYWHIPEYELEDTKRINVIPCEAYKLRFVERESFELIDLLRKSDFGEVYVIERRYTITVMIKMNRVVFIAIRGTKYLYDWVINMKTQKYTFDYFDNILFHYGFYRAISSCFLAISDKLKALFSSEAPISINKNPMPIYVTGHSLGGAMAAIMHAVWFLPLFREMTQEKTIMERRMRTHSCYTFGMPRYGNLNAVSRLRNPYHIYHDKDIVPTVPPRWFGFESCFNEYRLDGSELEKYSKKESIKFLKWIAGLVTGKGIKEHSIELYRRHLYESVKSSNDK